MLRHVRGLTFEPLTRFFPVTFRSGGVRRDNSMAVCTWRSGTAASSAPGHADGTSTGKACPCRHIPSRDDLPFLKGSMLMVYVYVLDKHGKPLMPTTRCGHVRRLLKSGKAVVVSTTPFTISCTISASGSPCMSSSASQQAGNGPARRTTPWASISAGPTSAQLAPIRLTRNPRSHSMSCRSGRTAQTGGRSSRSRPSISPTELHKSFSGRTQRRSESHV